MPTGRSRPALHRAIGLLCLVFMLIFQGGMSARAASSASIAGADDTLAELIASSLCSMASAQQAAGSNEAPGSNPTRDACGCEACPWCAPVLSSPGQVFLPVPSSRSTRAFQPASRHVGPATEWPPTLSQPPPQA
jgi:hypothetical protein